MGLVSPIETNILIIFSKEGTRQIRESSKFELKQDKCQKSIQNYWFVGSEMVHGQCKNLIDINDQETRENMRVKNNFELKTLKF